MSAVEADVARELEPRCAANVPVISTASAFRYESDVPVFLTARTGTTPMASNFSYLRLNPSTLS
jgi:hypothetical protein